LLKNELIVNTVEIKLDDQYLRTQTVVDGTQTDRIASFSSRGPGTRNGQLKPDISAPGVTVFSTGSGTGTEGESISGTSMAAPHVSGLMALLKQQHPTWTVEELKALAMNTASHDVFLNVSHGVPKIEPSRAGAGRIEAGTATASSLIAYETDEPGRVSVSFGPVESFGSTSVTRTVKVANKGGSAASFTAGYTPVSDVAGTSISFPDGTSFSVGANSSTTFRVQLNMNAALMKNPRDPSMAATQLSTPRQYLAEVTGLVTIAPTSGVALRLPLYAAPRPSSDMHAAQTALAATAATQTLPLGLAGTGVDNGTTPTVDIRSLVSAFELQAVSPARPPDASDLLKAGDLRYVGVSSDGRVRGTVSNSKLYFGVATELNWFQPAQEVWFSVLIDTNRDGTFDYELYNYQLTDGADDFTDVMVTGLYDFHAGSSTFPTYLNVFNSAIPTAIFNNNVQILSVPVSNLGGLSLVNTRFNYKVNVYYNGLVQDSTGTLTYDWLNPGVDVLTVPGDTPLFVDLPSSNITVTYNQTNFQNNNTLGLLLLHHYNRTGQRAEVVSVGRSQTVSFAPGSPTIKTQGDAPFAVSATATSLLPATIVSQTPAVCTIDGSNLVTLVGVGTCTLRATQAGNATFLPATPVFLNIAVAQGAPANPCAPRPRVAVTTSRVSAGHLQVTVTAGNGDLKSIRFGSDSRALQNASVQIVGPNGLQTTSSTLTVPLAVNTTSQTFTANQTVPGQAMTVPLVVTDGCGPWQTFVGVGAGG